MVAISMLLAVGCGSADDDAMSPSDGAGQGGAGTAGQNQAGSTSSQAGSTGAAGKPSAAGQGAAGNAGSTGNQAGSTGEAGETGTAGATEAGSSAAGSDAPNQGEPMELSISMKSVPASGEDHVCVVLPLPNTSAIWVKSIHAQLTNGSHHLIVDRRPVGTDLQMGASPCAPTMGGDATRLIIAQQHETQLDFPEGTALKLEPGQPIFMQLHYINLSEAAEDIEGKISLTLFDEEKDGTPTEVSSMFTGALSLQIPAGEASMGEFFYLPPASASRPAHVFAITSHTHSLGVESTIERVASQGAPDTTPLHVSTDWAEPPLTSFDPPLEFTGSDGLRLRCHYMNTTDHDVHVGTRFEDEMCFMWLYYY